MRRDLGPGDPSRIGPYRLIEVLGSGGMGRVFLGRSAGGRPVAVKVIRADLAADAEFRTRFRREVAAARQVNGFYTALVVDADVDGPEPWLATAYVPGPSLAEAVAGHGPLPPASLLVLAAGLAEGLAAIHMVGLVHRDLKPANVLLADDGPRVIDFGISRAVEASALTHTGMVIGSPGFMSPEQAEGDKVGPASDVFSLGAVLTFAATGHGPFGTGSTAALIYRIVHSPPRLDEVPLDIRTITERCLAKDPGLRPTAAEILAELGGMESAAGWLPETIAEEFPRYPPAATVTVNPPPPVRAPAPAETGAPVTAPEASAALASAHPAPNHVPDAGLPQDSAPSAVTVTNVVPPQPARPSPSVPLVGQPKRGRRFRRGTWLAAGVAVVVVAAAVPLALTSLSSSPGTVSTSTAAVSVYSGGQYGLREPDAIAVADGHVWVANYSGNSVTELDAATGAWIRTLSGKRYGFNGPHGITYDGTHIWVVNFAGSSVTELNADNGDLVRTLPGDENIFHYPNNIITDGAQLWVANFSPGWVTEIRASDGSVTRTLPNGKSGIDGPTALATDGSHIWIANEGAGINTESVGEINASDASLVRVISGSAYSFKWTLGKYIYGNVGIAVYGAHVWITNVGGNSVTELNVSNGALVRVISGGKYGFDEPGSIAATGNDIWVVNQAGNSVTELNADTGAWVHTLSGGSYHFDHPDEITVDGTHAWVTNSGNASGDGSSVTEFSVG